MTAPSPRVDLAYQTLRQAILEQALRPGDKLPEDEIGAHFGMSRTLARAVLVRLNGEGLVDLKRKRTATVAKPTLEEARAVFEVRRALEAEVVRLVIERWKPEFGAELEGLIREEDEARARNDHAVSVRLAGEFHIRLAERAGNPLLLRYISEVVSRCSLIMALYALPHSSDCAVNEHHELLDAFRAGDVGRAVDLMGRHVAGVERRALPSEEENGPASLSDILGRYADPISEKQKLPKLQRRKAASQ